MLPLTMVDKLGDYIAGTAIETVEAEELIKQYQSKIVDNVYGQAKDLDSVVEEMHKALQEKKVQMSSVQTEDAYIATPTATANKATWMSAKKVGVAQAKVSKVCLLALLVDDTLLIRFTRCQAPDMLPVPPRQPRPPCQLIVANMMRRRLVGLHQYPRWPQDWALCLRDIGGLHLRLQTASLLPQEHLHLRHQPSRMPQYHLRLCHQHPRMHEHHLQLRPHQLPAPRFPMSRWDFRFASSSRRRSCKPLQTKRLVMQSVARSSKVTESGMTAKESAEKP